MVFQTVVALTRSRGPDEFWRKRRVFKLAAHFIGRRRNCYSIAVRAVHRALAYATQGRKLKKDDMRQLWHTRLEAGSQQHDLTAAQLKEGLAESQILLNSKTLSDLAIWEPFTFQALARIAAFKIKNDIPSPPKDVFIDDWKKN